MDVSKRARSLNNYSIQSQGPIVYWMSRDQRVNNNWGLLFAQQLADQTHSALWVVFALDSNYPEINLRSFHFLLHGLMAVEKKLTALQIPFYLLLDNPEKTIPIFVAENKVSVLVTDFDPLKIKQSWKSAINKKISIPFYEVDAHNIIPCWIASGKLEFGAYTLRPKIKKLLPEYLTGFPDLRPQKQTPAKKDTTNWELILKKFPVDKSVSPLNDIKPNEEEAIKVLEHFIENKLEEYNKKKNDPNAGVTSQLSPYLNFGHISAQYVAMEIIKKPYSPEIKESFLEELIVRRELADNFCYYNPNYDNFLGFPQWAQKTLSAHKTDQREYLYTSATFEKAQTHDALWNAAQNELLFKGIIHGYMRMYWAKKILEWCASPEEALQTAIYLNNKYALDGRNPNGYVGCAWSIGGVHDRAWGNRDIFGKIRYMNENGCRRKFDIQKYCTSQNYPQTD
jgi:deoxyribodipyrimidine photo-lyase